MEATTFFDANMTLNNNMCKPKMTFFLKHHDMKKIIIIIPNGHNMYEDLQIGLKICPTLEN
jgi:hypothetical protein